MPEKQPAEQRPQISALRTLGEDAVYIKWTLIDRAARYIVARREDGETKFKKVGSARSGESAVYDRQVTPNVKYEYRVTAVIKNETGEEIRLGSEIKAITVQALPVPALESAKAEKDGAAVRWSFSGSADGFYIERRHAFMKKPVTVGTAGGGERCFLDRDIVSGQQYYYSVRSVISDGEVSASSKMSNEIAFMRLDAPAALRIKRRVFGSPTVYFRLTAGAKRYHVYKSQSENGEYTPCGQTEGEMQLKCEIEAAKGERGAFLRFGCSAEIGAQQFFSKLTKPVYVKF